MENKLDILNPDDKEYYDGKLYMVGIYPGAGVELKTFYVYAGYEEEALELVVALLDINDTNTNLLYTADEIDNMIYESYEEEYNEYVQDNPEADTYQFATDYLGYVYVDATMHGASQPYFVEGSNLRIEETNDEPIVFESKEEIKTEARLTDYLGILQIRDILQQNPETADKEFAILDDMKVEVGTGDDVKIYKATKNDDSEWELKLENKEESGIIYECPQCGLEFPEEDLISVDAIDIDVYNGENPDYTYCECPECEYRIPVQEWEENKLIEDKSSISKKEEFYIKPESDIIIWDSEIDFYDKERMEDIKSTQYQDYLDELGEDDEPMTFEDWYEDYIVDTSYDEGELILDDLKSNILPEIAAQCKSSDILLLSGGYNSNYADFRPSGAGAVMFERGTEDLLDYMSKFDRVCITTSNGILGGIFSDHDGTIAGQFYTLPDDEAVMLKALDYETRVKEEYDEEDIEKYGMKSLMSTEFANDIYYGGIDAHDLNEHLDELKPIRDTFTGHTPDDPTKKTESYDVPNLTYAEDIDKIMSRYNASKENKEKDEIENKSKKTEGKSVDKANALLDVFNEIYDSLGDMYVAEEWAEELANQYDIDAEDMEADKVILTALNKMDDSAFKEEVDNLLVGLSEDGNIDYLKDTLHIYPRNLEHIIACLNTLKPYASNPDIIDNAIAELQVVNLDLRVTAEEFQRYLHDNYKPWTVFGTTSGPRTYVDLFEVPTEYDIVGADYFNYANRPNDMLDHIGYGWKQDGENIVADLIGFAHSVKSGKSYAVASYDLEPVYYGYSAVINSSNKDEKFKEMAEAIIAKGKEIKEEYGLGKKEEKKQESYDAVTNKDTIGEIKEDGTVIKEYYGQGLIYKNFENYDKKSGPCYIAEYQGENEMGFHDRISEDELNTKNFNDMVEGEDYETYDTIQATIKELFAQAEIETTPEKMEAFARDVFEEVDWQSISALGDEWLENWEEYEDDEELNESASEEYAVNIVNKETNEFIRQHDCYKSYEDAVKGAENIELADDEKSEIVKIDYDENEEEKGIEKIEEETIIDEINGAVDALKELDAAASLGLLGEDKEPTGTITHELHTDLVPILNMNQYQAVPDELEYTTEELNEIMVDCGGPIIEEEIKSVFPNATVTFNNFNNPAYYKAFSNNNDTLDFTVSVPQEEYQAKFDLATNNDDFYSFLKETYKSYSGYVSFMADNIDDFITQDDWKQFVTIITYFITPYARQEEFDEKVLEECFERFEPAIEEDDMYEESKKLNEQDYHFLTVDNADVYADGIVIANTEMKVGKEDKLDKDATKFNVELLEKTEKQNGLYNVEVKGTLQDVCNFIAGTKVDVKEFANRTDKAIMLFDENGEPRKKTESIASTTPIIHKIEQAKRDIQAGKDVDVDAIIKELKPDILKHEGLEYDVMVEDLLELQQMAKETKPVEKDIERESKESNVSQLLDLLDKVDGSDETAFLEFTGISKAQLDGSDGFNEENAEIFIPKVKEWLDGKEIKTEAQKYDMYIYEYFSDEEELNATKAYLEEQGRDTYVQQEGNEWALWVTYDQPLKDAMEEKGFDTSIDNAVWSAVCSNDINFVKNAYNKDLIKPGTRYVSGAGKNSMIMGALRNNQYEMAELLKSFGETIRKEEVEEYKSIMAKRTYEDELTKTAKEEEFVIPGSDEQIAQARQDSIEKGYLTEQEEIPYDNTTEKECPVCKKIYTQYPALSRRDNKTYICPDCGVAEAMEDYANYMKNQK